ncbi:MAG TPA: tetratricopeptide repeat protein [Puia sp.]|nr:tetratricopeptide repeat protein [Puia sp.]
MAQPTKVDSLLRRLKMAKEDTGKVHLYYAITFAYFFDKADSAYYYAQLGEELSGRLNDQSGQATAIGQECVLITFKGNYPLGMQLGLKALRIADECKDPVAEADALDALGTAYYYQQDYRQALNYYKKCIPLALCGVNAWKHERALTNTGDTYQELGMIDSALFYSSQAYEILKKDFPRRQASDELNNLAVIYSKMGKDSVAHAYFILGMNASRNAEDFNNFCRGALGDARLFLKEENRDSAVTYSYLGLGIAIRYQLIARELDADKFIESLYESEGKTDSSFKYLKRTVALQDTLFSQERVKAIQNMTFEENIRQQELAAQMRNEAERQIKNLQLIAIALFIPIFFLLVVFLYRIKVKPRIIEFLAVMNLLLVFEFITDLTFPWISDWSKESPLWEMLILVLIASVLEPLNFKLESWLKRKLGTLG